MFMMSSELFSTKKYTQVMRMIKKLSGYWRDKKPQITSQITTDNAIIYHKLPLFLSFENDQPYNTSLPIIMKNYQLLILI